MGVLVNWALKGCVRLTPQTLATLPIYLLRKLPIYDRFLARKRVGWITTDRDKGRAESASIGPICFQ